MVERAGVEAGLGFKAHPHMLRHAGGYALANIREGVTEPQRVGWCYPRHRGAAGVSF